MSDRATINAQGIEVTFYKGDAYADYVSLTDIARYKSPTPKDVIKNWICLLYTSDAADEL